MVITTIAH